MQTKDKILQAALDCYNEEGLRVVTTRTIANRLGISVGNLHYHFKHTEDIITALFEKMAKEYDELLSYMRQMTLHDLSSMNEVFNSSFGLITKYKFVFLHFVELSNWVPAVLTLYTELVERQKIQLLEIFMAFIDKGIFRDDLPDFVWRGLARQIFIVSDFWLSNNELTDRLTGQAAAASYRNFMHSVFYPYLNLWQKKTL